MRATVVTFVLLLAGYASASPEDEGALLERPPGIYTCTDDRERQLRSDRLIEECRDREQRILNKDGSLSGVVPPTPLIADERDPIRYDRYLKRRFPNEAAHNQLRGTVLESVRSAIKDPEMREAELRRIERRFDFELDRLRKLWAGAQPGNLGPVLDGRESPGDPYSRFARARLTGA